MALYPPRYGACHKFRLLQSHHVPGVLYDDKFSVRDISSQVLAVLDGCHLILPSHNHQRGCTDRVQIRHDIEMVAGSVVSPNDVGILTEKLIQGRIQHRLPYSLRVRPRGNELGGVLGIYEDSVHDVGMYAKPGTGPHKDKPMYLLRV